MKSYRDQRAFIVQHAALVRQLALGKSGMAHGVLQPGTLRMEIGSVRAALDVLVETKQRLGTFAHTQAVALLLGEFARSADSSSLAVARSALDVMLDSGAVVADAALDDPPALVRAGLARDLAVAWALTADARYRDAAAGELRGLTRGMDMSDDRPQFADREAYVVIASLLPVAALTVAFPEGGSEPFTFATLWPVLVTSAVAFLALAGREVALRAGVLLYGLGCIAAYAITGRSRYLDIAVSLASVLDREYADPEGGYFDAAVADPSAPALADRTRPVFDGILPGANPWAARVLLQLAAATGDARYRRRAEATLEAFAGATGGEGLRAATYLSIARDALWVPPHPHIR